MSGHSRTGFSFDEFDTQAAKGKVFGGHKSKLVRHVQCPAGPGVAMPLEKLSPGVTVRWGT